MPGGFQDSANTRADAVMARKRKQEAVDVSHKFVKAVCYSGLLFTLMKGTVAQVVKRFCQGIIYQGLHRYLLTKKMVHVTQFLTW